MPEMKMKKLRERKKKTKEENNTINRMNNWKEIN